jgi:CheY-like chemotaxis protein
MKVRILPADNFPAFTDLVEGLLASKFDIVARVTNGEALFGSALDLNPDVIISDIAMPILNGIEAVR